MASISIDSDSAISTPNGVVFDAIVIGSGFGGAMAADHLLRAGKRVLMIERGDWVPRGEHNWADEWSRELTPAYTAETPYRILHGGPREFIGSFNCVGGPSVYYGGVAVRFREADFEPPAGIVGNSNAEWPYRYGDLEPFYHRAEELLDVAGDDRGDPTAPPRSAPYPQALPPLTALSRRIEAGARRLGLHPSRLPLAINYRTSAGRKACVRCTRCDGFACAVSAKNDLATTLIPDLLRRGLQLETQTVAVRLLERDRHIVGVQCFDKRTERQVVYRARNVVLAAGALATPHLLLASSLENANPGGSVVGRYLMRHYNRAVFGVFLRPPNPRAEFEKELFISDYYFGDPALGGPSGRLGSLQQFATPGLAVIRAAVPTALGIMATPFVPRLTGLLCIAEDQPQETNGVGIDRDSVDRFGLPQLVVRHRYSDRDQDAADALRRGAKRIMRRAGASGWWTYDIRTFSHAVGTVRMGVDPRTSALDGDGRYRGIANLFVTDASVMPTSAAVNPSLTIAAHALRAAERLANDSDNWSRPGVFSDAESAAEDVAAHL
jgi:choline dehydrogenase-like flavoprotein